MNKTARNIMVAAGLAAVGAGAVIASDLRSSLRQRPAMIVYVNDNATGTGTGKSWADAHTDLNTALAVARPGQQVWVASGIYRPTTTGDRAASFNLRNNISIYGGFAGTETALTQRNIVANPTILSGDIGVAGVNTDNSMNVVKGTNLNASTVVDGFTITGGYASNGNGGGMLLTNSSPTLNNMVFYKNYASMNGGGMYTSSSSSTVSNSFFMGNSANQGGGVYNSSPNMTFTNTVFSGNTAELEGGGLLSNGGSTTIANSSFSSNTSTGGIGGGMCFGGANITLVNSIAWNNTSTSSTINAQIMLMGGSTFGTANGYSIIQGNSGTIPGAGQLNVNPVFVDFDGEDNIAGTLDDDLRLVSNVSPAINAGNSAAVVGTMDIAGNPRVAGATVDLGAYESQ